MLEFTMSRVVLCICGVVLLGAAAVPFSGICSSEEDVWMTETADSIAGTIDGFYRSEADTMTLRGWDILPDAGCYFSVEGRLVILCDGEKEYISPISCASECFSLRYDGTVTLKRSGPGIAPA
ncbi:MAG: hypothetical protein PHY89_04760 [Candidatus Methanomethylophilaceae archaeon]|nr:hypothetical protein [Candidatus Methanomethylophilaceae archaeon]MDD3987080.1 hypothetical protein [Candidatus Methanomethylophilaceae archaeon]MDD4709205.1 hypothetical protein [Candidatus Methanomethylophilaceae archaeon]